MIKNICISLLLGLTLPLFSYTLSEAERAYVEKNWPVANAAYAEVCPTFSGNKQIACTYWQILALSQTGKSKEFQKAGQMIQHLLETISPRDTLYTDLVMTRAQFEIYLKQYGKARESIRHASEVSIDSLNPVLLQVCALLEKNDNSEESKNLCLSLRDSGRVEPKMDSSLSEKKIAQRPDSVRSKETTVEAPKVTREEGSYVLQLGAFSKKENAEALSKALESRGIETVIVERVSPERTLFLVHSKESYSRENAEKYGESVILPLKMEYSLVKKD